MLFAWDFVLWWCGDYPTKGGNMTIADILDDLCKRIEILEAVVDADKLQAERDERMLMEQSDYENRR